MNTQWRIEFFGGLHVRLGERVFTRFRTRKTASRLADIAFHCHRKHPREVLAEIIGLEHTTRVGTLKSKI